MKHPPYSHALLPSRFGFKWKRVNHRISKWGLRVKNKRKPSQQKILQAHCQGGPFTQEDIDYPLVNFSANNFTLESTDRVGFAHRTIKTTLKPYKKDSKKEKVRVSVLGLEKYRDVVPLITGYRFDTGSNRIPICRYDTNWGFGSRGFGIEVKKTLASKNVIELELFTRFETGTLVDRPRHNEALPEAEITAQVDIILVGLTYTPLRCGQVTYEKKYGEPKIGVEQNIQPASSKEQKILLEGVPGAPKGFFGIQGFNFELAPKKSCKWLRNLNLDRKVLPEDDECSVYGPAGYYIRELSTTLRQKRYDRKNGVGEFLFNGFASNATSIIPFHHLNYKFQGKMAWIQARGERNFIELSKQFQTGKKEFSIKN